MSEALIQRFEIEEVLSQTRELVRFRALDHESGKTVELIRFLPFGSGQEEGLSPKEQEAYLGSIGRLRSFEHPSLRKVLAGACDPVDGVPFVVVEPCDGETLEESAAPLPAPEAFDMLRAALELSSALSEVLNHPGIWIDTDPASVLRGRGSFRFAIHPLRIIGAEAPDNACLATLAQSAMRWKGRMIGDQTGEGLGGWVKWVRSAGANADPSEALERLLALRGGTGTPPKRPEHSPNSARARPPGAMIGTGGTIPPLAASRPGLQTTVRPAKKSAKAALIIITCFLVLAGGTIAWVSSRKHPPADQAAAAPQANASLTEAERIRRKAEELAALRKSQTVPLSPSEEEWDEPDDAPPPTARESRPIGAGPAVPESSPTAGVSPENREKARKEYDEVVRTYEKYRGAENGNNEDGMRAELKDLDRLLCRALEFDPGVGAPEITPDTDPSRAVADRKYRSTLLALVGRKDQALKDMEDAVNSIGRQQTHGKAYAQMLLGDLCLENLSDPAKAREWYQAALKTGPNDQHRMEIGKRLGALSQQETAPEPSSETATADPAEPRTGGDEILFRGTNAATLRKKAEYGQKVAWEWTMVKASFGSPVSNRPGAPHKVLRIFCDSADQKQRLQGLLRVQEQDEELEKRMEALVARINRDRPKVRILGTFLPPNKRGFVLIEASSIDDIQIVAP